MVTADQNFQDRSETGQRYRRQHLDKRLSYLLKYVVGFYRRTCRCIPTMATLSCAHGQMGQKLTRNRIKDTPDENAPKAPLRGYRRQDTASLNRYSSSEECHRASQFRANMSYSYVLYPFRERTTTSSSEKRITLGPRPDRKTPSPEPRHSASAPRAPPGSADPETRSAAPAAARPRPRTTRPA